MRGQRRAAAEAARERLRLRLADLERRDPAIEMQFSLPDPWSRRLFLALCRHNGLKPYRYRRQRTTTVMVRLPRGFLDRVLWPEFKELNRALEVVLAGSRADEETGEHALADVRRIQDAAHA